MQETVPRRLELTAGIKQDQVFGPIVAVGLGGLMVEILGEVAMLRPPFDQATARRAVESLCKGRISHARRGLVPAEIDAVAAILTALGSMALELPEIVEIDANPIRIANGAAIVADALIVKAGGT